MGRFIAIFAAFLAAVSIITIVWVFVDLLLQFLAYLSVQDTEKLEFY